MDTIKEFFSWIYGALGFLGEFFTPTFWTALLIQYKYWIVIGGALIEGEVLLMLAGGAAYHGHLSLYWVMLIAFIGAVIHDHLLFFIGRYMGSKIIYKYPSLHNRAAKISDFMHRYDRWFIMSFRFIYGVRTVTPIIVGTTSIPLRRYSLLVTISALVWAVVVAYLGYAFAIAIDVLLENFAKYSKYFGIGLIVLGVVIFAIVRFMKGRNQPPAV
jgi:membrane protein DedA with SNARE-associated domain